MFFFKKRKKEETSVFSHVNGSIIGLTDIPDEVFSQKTLGDGFAVIASGPFVKAPVDGTIVFLAPTKHAVGIEMDNGIQILIHIGLDSAVTIPENFQVKVEEGQKVSTGDILVEIAHQLLEDVLYIPLIIMENPDNVAYTFVNLNTDAAAGTEVIKLKNE